MSATTAKEQLQARLDATPIRTVIESLLILDAQMADPDQVDAATRFVRAKLIDHLETRFPEAAAAVEAAFDAAEETGENVEVDYVAVLVAAIPANEK